MLAAMEHGDTPLPLPSPAIPSRDPISLGILCKYQRPVPVARTRCTGVHDEIALTPVTVWAATGAREGRGQD